MPPVAPVISTVAGCFSSTSIGERFLVVVCLGVGYRDPHGGVVPFALLALVRRVLLFLAKALYHTAQRFSLDALFAPLQTPLFVFGARMVELGRLLAQGFTQTIDERAVVLQFDRVGGAPSFTRLAHILVAVGPQLFELALQVGNSTAGLAHRPAQIRCGCRGEFLNGFEPF